MYITVKIGQPETIQLPAPACAVHGNADADAMARHGHGGLELAGVDEQDGPRRRRGRRRPVAIAVEVLDAPDVLVAGEAAPARDSGGGGVVGREVGGDDGAGRVLACHVVRVAAERPEQRRAPRPRHAHPVEEVGAEGPEHVRHRRNPHPWRAAVELPDRGETRPEQPRRALHPHPQRARRVPHAQHGERAVRGGGAALGGLDGEEGAEGELVVEESGEICGEELGLLWGEMARVGGGGERGLEVEDAVAGRDGQAARVHGPAQEHGPPERRVPEPAHEESQRRLVGRRRRHGRPRRAPGPAPLLRRLHQRRPDPLPPASKHTQKGPNTSALSAIAETRKA